MIVSEIVAHILDHVNAEASDSDESQVAGVESRAQFVRDAVESLVNDDRNRSLGQILQEIRKLAPGGPRRASFRRLVKNIIDEGEAHPHLAIQRWVGTNLESREQYG